MDPRPIVSSLRTPAVTLKGNETKKVAKLGRDNLITFNQCVKKMVPCPNLSQKLPSVAESAD